MENFVEEWRPIVGFEGLYEVSSLGRIKALSKTVTRKSISYKLKEKILKPQPSGNGYLKICLHNNGRKKFLFVHRLVAEAFLPNPKNKPCIDHINTIRDDNRVNNLKWCTQKENCNNPITVHKMSESTKKVDKVKINKLLQDRSCQNASKMVYQYDLDGNYIRSFNSVIEAAIELNVPTKSLVAECNRRQHHFLGYLWYYDKLDRVPKYKPRRRKIAQYTKYGKLVKVWDCISNASKEYNNSNIALVCKGIRKTASGFVWRYVD